MKIDPNRKAEFESVKTIIEEESPTPTRSKPIRSNLTIKNFVIPAVVFSLVLGAYYLGVNSCKATCQKSITSLQQEVQRQKSTSFSKISQKEKVSRAKTANGELTNAPNAEGSKTSKKISTHHSRPEGKQSAKDNNEGDLSERIGIEMNPSSQDQNPTITHRTQNEKNKDKKDKDFSFPFLGVALSFYKDPNDHKYKAKAIDVHPEADFLMIGYWNDQNKPKNGNQDATFNTFGLEFKREEDPRKGYHLHGWTSYDLDSHQLELLAKQEMSLIACIAGKQFSICGETNYGCAAVNPGTDSKVENIKIGYFALITYWMDLECSLHAIIDFKKRGKSGFF